MDVLIFLWKSKIVRIFHSKWFETIQKLFTELPAFA